MRDRALLDMARGCGCTVKWPGVCNRDNRTVVAAHSNQLRDGKGFGWKSRDDRVAFCCAACHFAIDAGMYTQEEKLKWFERGARITAEIVRQRRER